MPTQNGWSSSSMNSTRRRSGDKPLQRRPAASSFGFSWAFSSQRWRWRSLTTGSPYARYTAGVGFEDRVVRAEALRAALVDDVTLVVHQRDHRMRRRRVHLGRVRAGEVHHVAGELDGHRLQAEADAKARDVVLAGEPCCGDLAFETALAEAAGDQHAVELGEPTRCQKSLDIFGLDPVDLDLGPVVEAGVLQALDNRQICIGQADVLADEADLHRLDRLLDHRHDFTPRFEIDRRIEAQHIADDVVETLVVQDQRQLVDVSGIGGVDHGTLVDIAEVGDLALQVVAERLFTATHDHVGLDATAAQLGDRVLRRLGLLLSRRSDERHQRHVEVADVVATGFLAELADRLEKGKDLDVAHGAADLGDHDIDVVIRQPVDAPLDLVGDVRDDLHGLSQVVAAALGGQHGLVDGSGRCVGVAASAVRR